MDADASPPTLPVRTHAHVEFVKYAMDDNTDDHAAAASAFSEWHIKEPLPISPVPIFRLAITHGLMSHVTAVVDPAEYRYGAHCNARRRSDGQKSTALCAPTLADRWVPIRERSPAAQLCCVSFMASGERESAVSVIQSPVEQHVLLQLMYWVREARTPIGSPTVSMIQAGVSGVLHWVIT